MTFHAEWISLDRRHASCEAVGVNVRSKRPEKPTNVGNAADPTS